MQLSGTSMAAGVVSGAVALLMGGRSDLAPHQIRVALDVTSSFLSYVGLLGAGAGFVVPPAAMSLVCSWGENSFDRNKIFNVGASTRLLSIAPCPECLAARFLAVRNGVNANTIIWGSFRAGTIIWGTARADAILERSASASTIIWGSVAVNAIIWGSADGDAIIWGSSGLDGDTIIWGTMAEDYQR
jgi:hypothetical protein